MAVRVATVIVLAALTVVILVRDGFAQPNQCCAARLTVCHNEALNEKVECVDDCYEARNAAQDECDRHPRPSCLLIGPLFARCMQRCTADLQRGLLLCLVRHKACINEPDCRNTPTVTRTVTRTQTPTSTPPPGGVVIPTPTATPPPS